MASKKQLKHSHRAMILLEQKLPEAKLLPGMVVTFAYNKKGVWDRRPIFFFMRREGKLISGVNFNYLKAVDIQRFYKHTANSVEPVQYENLIKLKEDYQRVQIASRLKARAFTAQTIYKMVMPRDMSYKEAYRSYNLEKVASLKIVNLKLDILEDVEEDR